MRILVWPLHGGWMDGFTRGDHEYLIPDAPDGTGGTGGSPESSGALRDADVDVVVLQRPEEIEWTRRLLGRTPGIDVPAVFVEHNTPKREPVGERHPLAEQRRIPIVHVTHFNRLVWDCGDAPTAVIEHGVPDPGRLYSGELPALGVVINEPVRRGRVTGTDLLPAFSETAPLDCFGIDVDRLPGALGLGPERLRTIGDLPTARLHAELARRRAYLHPLRWTSLGLSLLEAMTMGMPVLVLATTEAPRAVPPEAGAISADPDELRAAARRLMEDPDEARERGLAARAFALEHYGLERFLADWDALLEERAASHARAPGSPRTGPSTSGAALPARAASTEGELR